MNPTDSLKVTLPSEREIALSRTFDAPRHLVFEAYTRPELLKRWLGVFGGWTLDLCEVDLRVGGTVRYVWRHAHGQEMGMTATYREIVVPERLVADERFDDPWYEGKALGTITFVEEKGRTTLTILTRYDSQAIRDAILKSGMEGGVGASFDQLAIILSGLA